MVSGLIKCVYKIKLIERAVRIIYLSTAEDTHNSYYYTLNVVGVNKLKHK